MNIDETGYVMNLHECVCVCLRRSVSREREREKEICGDVSGVAEDGSMRRTDGEQEM